MAQAVDNLVVFDHAELTSWLSRPEATTVRAVRLAFPDAGGSWIVRALVCAELPALRSLTLDYCEVGDDGMLALADSGLLGRLDELVVADDTVTDVGVRAVVSSPAVKGLTALDLSRSPVNDDACRAIAASPYLTGLTRLGVDLAAPWVPPAAIAALVDSAALTVPIKAAVRAQAATRLGELVAARPSEEAWVEKVAMLLAAAGDSVPAAPWRRWPARCRPALDGWLDRALTGRPVPALRLAGCLQPYRLRGSGRTAEDLDAVRTLMRHPDAANIRCVDLRYLRLTSRTLVAWLSEPWLSTVTELDLRGHQISASVLDALTATPAATGLRVLGLGANG